MRIGDYDVEWLYHPAAKEQRSATDSTGCPASPPEVEILAVLDWETGTEVYDYDRDMLEQWIIAYHEIFESEYS